MELSKHSAHRNAKYLSWLRKRPCIVSGEKAQCAHHIRLGTNGGCSLKPSDYFCVPLLHKYHTTGPDALHLIGEETFLRLFNLNYKELFVQQLRDYLAENFDIYYALTERQPEELIADLISLIESNIRPKDGAKTKVSKSKKKESQRLDDNFHQVAKKLQSERNKELRAKIKAESKQRNDQVVKKSLKDDPNYIKAREQKRAQDKELRDKLKKERPKGTQKISLKENEFYQKAKEARKAQEREYRKLHKERLKEKSQSDQP